MATRLPKANTAFQKYSNTDLVTYAQAIHDGMLAAIATFPTPPVSAAALQTLIDNYEAALAASIDGSKLQKAQMHRTRALLWNALRSIAAYVNQIIYLQISQGASYEDAEALILSTGFELSKQPEPVGELPAPIVRSWSSPQIGQLYILVERLPGARAYEVVYKIVGQPDSSEQTAVSPSTRIKINGLTSGQNYSFRVAGVGSETLRMFGSANTQVII